jgi:hypothetical protein
MESSLEGGIYNEETSSTHCWCFDVGVIESLGSSNGYSRCEWDN